MGSIGANKNTPSISTATVASTAESRIPSLDKDLIRRANEAGMAVDYGDSTSRMYEKNANEILGMDLSDDKKTSALKELHSLTETQLDAEAKSKSPYSYGMGPARFNANKIRQNADKAVTARGDVDRYMNKLRDDQRKAAQRRENQALTNAMKQAIDSGALEFTHNGTTWVRGNRRSRKFTAKR